MSGLSDFTNLYSLSKTLRFELIPISNNFNWETFKKSVTFQNDEKRANAYPIVKTMLDQLHKWFIEDALKNVEIDWTNLAELYMKDKKSENYKKEQNKLRKHIVDNFFKKHQWWDAISSKHSKIITEIIPYLLQDDYFIETIIEQNPDYTRENMLAALENFKSFSGNFEKYYTNRKNMYISEAKSSAIAYRIIHDNFPKFIDNIKVYQKLTENCLERLKSVEKGLSEKLQTFTFEQIFISDFFNALIRQQGIDFYNNLIGGSPQESISGINNVGNLFLQNNPKSTLKLKELKMVTLFNQILSDKDENPIYIPDKFENEDEIIPAIQAFFKDISQKNILDNLKKIMQSLNNDDVDKSKIFVIGKSLTILSKELCGDWDKLGMLLRNKFVTGNSKTAKSERDKEIQNWIENKVFSLAEIAEVENDLFCDKKTLEILSSLTTRQGVDLIKTSIDDYIIHISSINESLVIGNRIQGNDVITESLKTCLDNFLNLLHFAKLVHLGKKEGYLDKDDTFYIEYNETIKILETVIPLYNKVRNFLTRKLEDEGKMLLKFDFSTFTHGWNYDSGCFIVKKEKNYFLIVVTDKFKKTDAESLLTNKFDNSAYRVIHKQQKMDFKNFPRWFIFSKGDNYAPAVAKYNLPINSIADDYNKYRKLKDDEKDIFLENNPNFRNNLINYFKECVPHHEALSPFKEDLLKIWKDTSQYKTLSEFYDDTLSACYRLDFEKICYQKLLELDEQGKIFIFQIQNKDFRKESKGTKNLHTLYWEQLFDKQNLEDVIFKLSGQGAELFYRAPHQNVKKTPTHKKDEVLVNKIYSNGVPIPRELYLNYCKYFKIGKNETDLSDKAKENLHLVKTNIAKLDLIKDKRYSENKLLFHVPITLNFKPKYNKLNATQFNQFTLKKLRENKNNINIIGIDRGERHLLYISVINQKGEHIIPPKSFNIIEKFDNQQQLMQKIDYQQKLVQVEGNRNEARKNWKKIGKITDLKEGYLSLVIHEIAKLMIEYNAIVVLEDLNYGFKRGRFAVERQIYQKFEKMLIDKLNFLVFKKNPFPFPLNNFGNLHNALQLTAPFESFKDLGKQSGWLFYVNASYTSKIDPKTGFVNLFNMKDAQKDTKSFFEKFSEIKFSDGLYQFSFDYRNQFSLVGNDYTNTWTVCSNGERLKYNEEESVNLNDRIDALLSEYGIDKNSLSLKEIKKQTDEKFFNELFYYFKLCLQMRNTDKENDYLISPIRQNDAEDFFDSRKDDNIKDADANGAYHIAKKGLFLVKNNFPTDTVDKNEYIRFIKNEEWLQFTQKNK